jgi:hypothetical protein
MNTIRKLFLQDALIFSTRKLYFEGKISLRKNTYVFGGGREKKKEEIIFLGGCFN